MHAGAGEGCGGKVLVLLGFSTCPQEAGVGEMHPVPMKASHMALPKQGRGAWQWQGPRRGLHISRLTIWACVLIPFFSPYLAQLFKA